MAGKRKQKDKNFLVQGSILAVAGVITKLIGAACVQAGVSTGGKGRI